MIESTLSSASHGTICYLHVGMDVTGVPSIQKTLREHLAPGNFHFLELGSEDHGKVIAAAFSNHPLRLRHLHNRGWSEEQGRDHAEALRCGIAEEIRNHPGKVLIVSSVAILDLQEQELVALRDFFSARFSRVCVVAFVRPPGTQMDESFASRLKIAGTPLDFGKTWPAYRRRLGKFEIVFGREQLLVLPYGGQEKAVEDFCQFLGISSPNIHHPKANSVELSMDAAALLFAYRIYGGQHQRQPENARRDRKLVRALQDPEAPKFGFSDGVVDNIRKQRSTDLEWISDRLGAPLQEDPSIDRTEGIRTPEDLLIRSVAASERLLESNASKFVTSVTCPRTAREAAQIVHDLANTLVPPEGENPKSGAFPPSATLQERENLLQADRLVINEGAVCYIHIGMPKTGTTSIQNALGSIPKNSLFTYMTAGGANHSEIINAMVSGRPERWPPFQKRGWSNTRIQNYVIKAKALVDADLRANSNRKFIISGESLVRLKKSELRNLKQFIGRYFTKIHIVAYLREPKSYMESIFQQRLKGGASNCDFTHTYPGYADKIRKFDHVFGAENVILRKFDPELFPNRDVVLDFCQLLGISPHAYEMTRTNETLSLEAIALLFAYRKFMVNFGNGKRAILRNRELVNALRMIKGGKLSFSDGLMSSIFEKIRGDLSWTEQRTGFSLSHSLPTGSLQSIGTVEDLIALSMDGARRLVAVLGDTFTPTYPDPTTPRQAAKVLHDYLVMLDPEFKDTFPLLSADPSHHVVTPDPEFKDTVPKPAPPQQLKAKTRPRLFRKLTRWLRKFKS